jgi:biopolymer transport protein ExbD
MNISLPSAASRPKEKPSKVNYITVDNAGRFFLTRTRWVKKSCSRRSWNFASRTLISTCGACDSRIQYQKIVSVLDVLVSANVNKVGLATEAVASR